jgi:hypothetical protein
MNEAWGLLFIWWAHALLNPYSWWRLFSRSISSLLTRFCRHGCTLAVLQDGRVARHADQHGVRPADGASAVTPGDCGVRHRCLTPAALLCWREQKVASLQLAKCRAA